MMPQMDDWLPQPLEPLPDLTDEDAGFNPANVENVILFRRVDAGVSALLDDIRSGDGGAGLMDFRRIVPVPDSLPKSEMRDWGEANWGVDHNAGGAKLVERLGFRGVGFFTEVAPIPVLRALAAKHPNVSWTYYGCAWQLNWCATGEASGGSFTINERKPTDDADSRQIRAMCFGVENVPG